jgi:uncharacterized membrane protein YdjX (TVP38/TMEM64 family)
MTMPAASTSRQPAPDAPQPTPPRTNALFRLGLLVVVLGGAWMLADRTGLLAYAEPTKLGEAVRAAREVPWAAPAFIAAYAIVATLGLPGTPLTLAGGAIFGSVFGTALNWLGATLGATGAFFLARALGGDTLRSFLGKRAAALDALTDSRAFLPLLRLRLIPVVPFNALNFGAGLTGVRPSTYVASTALGIIPGTAIYTYFADALLAGVDGARSQALQQVAIAAALLIALSFVPTLAKRFGWISALLIHVAMPSTQAWAQAARDVPATSARAPGATVDHGAWSAMLGTYVTDGMVDYDAFRRDARFRAYLRRLEAVNPEALPPQERLAYWINVYNAFTIELINSRNERRSIRNINKVLGVPTRSPWAEPIITVRGRALTLDDVEHEIIRKQFAEPRIHVALVCAAIGCPPLRSEAFVAERLDAQLDDQVRRFLTQRGKNRVDVANRTVHGSPIFTWYREDFGGTLAGVGAFWAPYVDDPAAQRLLRSGEFRWVDTDYDWSLNLRRPAQAGASRR